MENVNIQSDFQFVDSYIVNSNIKIIERNIKKGTIEVQVSVAISEIMEKNGEKYVETRLINNVKINNSDTKQTYVIIDVEMSGEFKSKNLTDEDFEEYIKFSGIPMLSQSIRAYVMSLTALSGIKPVRIPMINFKEYFDSAEIIDEK